MSNKKKTTKRSLISSVISLILCISMLIGTTFAWFTDSVTSGRNRIIAGNLDVELYHQSKNVSLEKVTPDTDNLFKDITLWEPGAYTYETFTVKNEGTLALKYKMELNVASYTSYNGHNLTEVLKVKTVDDVPETRPSYADGEALEEWSLDSGDIVLQAQNDDGTEVGSEKTFTVVIYWEPTDHDNDYNMNNGRPQPMTVDLGVQLVATQATVENDSFDDQYDKDANNSLSEVTKVESAMASATVDNNGSATLTAKIAPAAAGNADTEVTLTGMTGLANEELKLNVETVGVVGTSGYVIAADSPDTAVASFDLSLIKNDGTKTFTVAADGQSATVKSKIAVNAASDASGLALYYWNGTSYVQETGAVINSYDPATGEIEFTVPHFSTYVVAAIGGIGAYNVNKDTAYTSLTEAYSSANAEDTLVLMQDVNLTSVFLLDKSIVIKGQGHSIKNTANRVIRVTKPDLHIEMYDLGIISLCTAGSDERGLSFDMGTNNTSVLLDGCTVSAGFYAINAAAGTKNLNITVKNGTVAAGWAAINFYPNESTITVENSVLRGLNDKGESSWNDFGTIVFDGNGLWDANNIGKNGSDNNIIVKGSTIYASSDSSNNQAWLCVQYGARNNHLTLDSATKIIDADSVDQSENICIVPFVGYDSGKYKKSYDVHSSVSVDGNKEEICYHGEIDEDALVSEGSHVAYPGCAEN